MQRSILTVFIVFLASYFISPTAGFTQSVKAVDREESLSQFLTTVDLHLPTGKPAVGWKAYSHNFGRVQMGDTVSHHFVVTNTGAGPLRITGVTTSCGCTVSGYTETDILPGKRGIVTATFTPKAHGPFEQFLTVVSNTEAFVDILTITGVVDE